MADIDKTWLIYSYLRAHPNIKFNANFIASMFLNNDALSAYTILTKLSTREPSTIKKELIKDSYSFCFYYYNPKEIKQKCWTCDQPIPNNTEYCPHCGIYQSKLFKEIYI